MLKRVRSLQSVFTDAAALGRRHLSKKRQSGKVEPPPKDAKVQGDGKQKDPKQPLPSSAQSVAPSGAAASTTVTSGGKPAQTETSLSLGQQLFIGAGALICGGVGYYAWTHRQATGPPGVSLQSQTVRPVGSNKEVNDAEKSAAESGQEDLPLNRNETESMNKISSGGVGENDPVKDSSEMDARTLQEGSPTTTGASERQEEEVPDGKGVSVDLTPVNDLFVEALGLKSGQEEDKSDTQLQGKAGLEDYLDHSEDVGIIKSALINAARSAGMGPWDNDEWKHVHLQAESDALYFQDWGRRTKEKFMAESQGLKAQIVEITAKLAKSEESKQDYKKEMNRLIEEQEKLLNNLKEKELDKQAAYLAVAAAEAAVKERVERMKVLDGIRHEMNGLSVALEERTQQAKTGHTTHKIAESVLSLEMCLENGLPCQNLVSVLRSSCGEDNLLSAVLDTLSDDMSSRGVQTVPQLTSKYNEVKRELLAMGMLPPNGGGLLAQLVARLGASLKVWEPGTGLKSGIVSGLTCAEESLVNGNVSLAADQVEQVTSGTAAATVAHRWIANARDRAIAEQAVKLLHARATCLTVSLA